MKRYISILVLMCISLCTMAQSELKINKVFEGKAVVLKDKEESFIQGKALKNYRLHILHTLKFTVQENGRNEVERLFKIDMEEIKEGEEDNMEMESRNDHLYYAVVQLDDYYNSKGKCEHRFICYQCKKVGEDYRITLAYIRGKATMYGLRRMFKK